MSQKHYQSQFKAVLGVGAWPGTLNVEVGRESLDEFSTLRVLAGLEEGDARESVRPLRIEGFERDEFLHCLQCKFAFYAGQRLVQSLT